MIGSEVEKGNTCYLSERERWNKPVICTHTSSEESLRQFRRCLRGSVPLESGAFPSQQLAKYDLEEERVTWQKKVATHGPANETPWIATGKSI